MIFEKITNFEEKLDLKVQNHQTFFIESIDECLIEAKYYDGWNAYKIILNDEIIAFAMYGQFPEENNRVYLDRFFIDEKHQQKGYFRQIMPLLLEKIKKEYNISEIYLSVFRDNEVAFKLFLEQDFKEIGEVDLNGEIIMVKNV
ncbi:MAG: GNAT family N-acetyltransferase [Clostridia bacterium]